jgi:ABC-type uncharacterized transport system ATPase subunit
MLAGWCANPVRGGPARRLDEVRAGEVVGIAGVSGNGQRELLYALSGEDTRAQAGMIEVAWAAGRPHAARASAGRWACISCRKSAWAAGPCPCWGWPTTCMLTRNEAFGAGGWIRLGVLERQATAIIQRFGVKAGGPHAAAKSLSGGNLQKFIVGREIDANPKLLIVSQPTWGVDVGAAAQIRGEILALRDAGCAVLVVSEELDELFEICDRLHVMAKGHLSPSVDRADATALQMGEWMSGLWHDDVQAPGPHA